MPSKMPLLVSFEAIKNDPALAFGNRGARKIGVTSIFNKTEHSYEEPVWFGDNSQTPVMPFSETEYAVFNELTVQDRHYHAKGTEFYTVLDGNFSIEVENTHYHLTTGDTIIVPAGAIHEVFRETSFTAMVITVQCGGIEDKYIVKNQ